MDELWRDDGVIQRNLHLLNSGFMADCTFVVGRTERKRIQCHKFILSQGSPVFYAMFNGELQEKGDVRVKDIEPQPFRKMLDFIYSDTTTLENAETALSVCYAAHKYMINTLTLKCIDFIKKNLHADIVCSALEFARLVDNADLEDLCLQYLKDNTPDVLKSASLPNAAKATLITILNQDTCNTSEFEFFFACIRWAEAQRRGDQVSLRDVLGPEVLSLIRFLTMTAQKFATVVIPSKLLSLQEERDILCRLVTGVGNLPQGFNTSKENRVLTGPRETVVIQSSPSHWYNGSDYQTHGFSGQQLNSHPFNLNVNVDCFIYGLQLGGLSAIHSSGYAAINAGFAPVQDKFGVNLMQGSELLACAEYEGLMFFNTSVKLNFKRSVLLRANTSYTLQMKYSNLSTSYMCTQSCQNVYSTTAGVRMTVNFDYTAITQIYIAQKI